MTLQQQKDVQPWYRQFWPWFLIALPATAVVASLWTVSVAVRSPNALVMDDYGKIGIATDKKKQRDELAAALSATHFAPPRFPVYANATAAPVGDVATNLGEQLVNPVRFAATLEAMATAGVDTFVHVGPGDVTAGMVKRTVPDASVLVVSVLDDIPPVAEALNLQ